MDMAIGWAVLFALVLMCCAIQEKVRDMGTKNARTVSVRESNRRKPWWVKRSTGVATGRFSSLGEALVGAERVGRVVFVDMKSRTVVTHNDGR